MSFIDTPAVTLDGTLDEDVALPKPAAFLMAMGNIVSAIRENEATYNDPTSTDGQRRAIESTVKAKIMEAFNAHVEVFRKDVEAYAAVAEKCRAHSDTTYDNKKKRIDMLAKAMNNPMANMSSDGQPKRKDIIPIRLQILYWILAIVFVFGSELAILDPLARVPRWPLVLAVVAVMMLPAKFHEAFRTHRCFYWYSIYSLSVLAGVVLEPAVHVLSTEPSNDRQLLSLRWCTAFVIISEAEWHRHLHATHVHPIARDIMPTREPDWCEGPSVSRAFAKAVRTNELVTLITRTFLATLVGIPPVMLLRTIGDVPGQASGWIPFHGNALYPPSWVGIAPQYLVLTRPVKHLMAWLTDYIFDIGVLLWHRARRWYLYRHVGVP